MRARLGINESEQSAEYGHLRVASCEATTRFAPKALDYSIHHLMANTFPEDIM